MVAAAVDPRRLVFVDEIGTNTALSPRYAYSLKGSRAYAKVPPNRGVNTTLLASMSLEGMDPCLAVEGTTTAPVFEAYVEQVLAPSLRRGQIVVVDNLGAHKGARVRKLIEERGCQILYLPPYSPDFNPIEGISMKIAARIVAELAAEILALKDHIELIDKEIEQRFFNRPEAEILASLPGMGPILGAEFLVAVGNLSAFDSAEHLAAYSQVLCPLLTTPAKGSETTAGCVAATRISREFSTRLPLPACAAHRSPGPSMTAEREPRASGTPRRSSRWRVGG